jgi:RHH-type proline utilization regulon transcriptional repressor/proline dehydrogenase/delta 1-pyrroline-5-carboxylate dehydrogenase
MSDLHTVRQSIRALHNANESTLIEELSQSSGISTKKRERISKQAESLVEAVRADDQPGLMEEFLAEYGLSSDEGIALMCLAEALLRVPDADTIDQLIEDKIAPSSWGEHLGQSSSSLVNASTWALMLTGKVLSDEDSSGVSSVLRTTVRRLGEPVIRAAVTRAIKEMGNQFVLGETIEAATARASGMESKGYTYSYDMLGEAALTQSDAQSFFDAYEHSINALSVLATADDIRDNPGISIKLSALHPRYEFAQTERVMSELVDSTLALALKAKSANIGLNIDAEESERLELSLDVIESVLSHPELSGWDGFGVVVQAYGKRCHAVIDWLYALATTHSRKIMVRLVKGAYWDSEIKRAQVEGLADYPVFTHKSATDAFYMACAEKLLSMTDRIYPQFATHNAHTISTVLALADDKQAYEFQRLHGMGEALHRTVLNEQGTRCRIYAPVGAHSDLLAYLVRRLLENGANSSFVNQLVDESIPASALSIDPLSAVLADTADKSNAIIKPPQLFFPIRMNSAGWDLQNISDWQHFEASRNHYATIQWHAEPLMAEAFSGEGAQDIFNPANPEDKVGSVIEATHDDTSIAVSSARAWDNTTATQRATVLERAADLYEQHATEIFAILAREAGKTANDAVAELREAVDFLRFYATEQVEGNRQALGIVACISPWNFPLAIFTGQIAAALSAGNGVVAKPAESTPIIAFLAVRLLHQAGVPKEVLQLLPGQGATVGAALTSNPIVQAVCFTGSTATAIRINRSMAEHLAPGAPLIAETGGINAMIVDSTALPEQAIKDIVASAFQSAGQRCSALRLLYVQEDIADTFKATLYGAMDELNIGDPWQLKHDLGPAISKVAQASINQHINKARSDRRLLKKLDVPKEGWYVSPSVISVHGMADMQEESFGPVLHLATFKADQIEQIITDVNSSGYGLTFGLHSRIDDRVELLTSKLSVGNMYINRNQIGAVVGSQPFGGEGLSGTGPKAGGPHYVKRFTKERQQPAAFAQATNSIARVDIQNAINQLQVDRHKELQSISLPGPTGESNRLTLYPRGVILCLGPTPANAAKQAAIATSQGCAAIVVCPECLGPQALDGFLDRDLLTTLSGFDAVALWSNAEDLRITKLALAARDGVIIPLITERDMADRCVIERHVCVDTTASGGNASLLAGTE